MKAEIGERNELLIQDGRTERHVLLSTFKRNEDSSLFATSSFWEGIDAPGNTLRLVIIVKLPFEVPSDLVVHNEKLLVGGIWCIVKISYVGLNKVNPEDETEVEDIFGNQKKKKIKKRKKKKSKNMKKIMLIT